MVVDVSIEIALLARLHGVPVVLVAQRGIRHDAAHALAYAQASAIAAPWTAATHLPGEGPPERLLTFTGAVYASTASRRPDDPKRVAMCSSSSVPAATSCARRTCSRQRGRLPTAGGTSPARCGRRRRRTSSTTGRRRRCCRCCARARSSSGRPGRTSSPRSRRRVGRSCAFPAEAVPGTGASGGGAPPAGRRDRVHATAPHIGVARAAARCGSATDGPVGSAARRSRGFAPCGGRPGCGVQRMRVAVATLARGRALHLQRQALAVSRLRPAPSAYVVLALDERRPDPPGATGLPARSHRTLRFGWVRRATR